MWFERFLDEDIGFGDITSELLLTDEGIIGTIFAKEECVLAGLDEIFEIFTHYGVKCTKMAGDGDRLLSGDVVMELRGKAKDILRLERAALNILGHMSGIATKASGMIEIAKKENPNIRVAVTRKTIPGLRNLDKKAAMLGGADTHRLRLDDHILIKDNHLAVVGDVKKAVERAKKASFVRKIEVEVESLEDALSAAKAGADIIMLDNMSTENAEKTYEKIKSKYPQVLIEISGGINEDNIAGYAKYADIISSGSITHSARSIDFSMEVELII